MDALRSDHPSDQILQAYGVGELQSPLADSVNSHLEFCAGCRQRVAELCADTFLERLRDAHIRPDSPALGEPPLRDQSKTEGMPDAIEPFTWATTRLKLSKVPKLVRRTVPPLGALGLT